MKPMHYLNGYRLMWMIVLFDLPVITRKDRKEYTRFRNYLLDCGFSMAQFSVYMRLVSCKERVSRFEKKIANQLPKNGQVQIITITDKQYENIKVYDGNICQKQNKNDQFQLF